MNLRGKLDRLQMSSGGASAAVAAPISSSLSASPLDDLRSRMREILERTALPPRPPSRVDAPELPFVTHDTPSGPLHIRQQRLAASHRMGRVSLLPARDASTALLALLALDPSLASCDPSRALYLDTETTGLAGGAGTVAFLVGLAYWDGVSAEDAASGNRGLMIEQILVRRLGEEAPMLEHVASRIRDASMLVSYNGKSFDLPLIRTRFVMAKVDAPVEPPHFDLLHVARRLHRARLRSRHGHRDGTATCKLTTIEKLILGFERHDDVPSADVSAHYLHFLRTGDTKALLGVVEHNAWDVIAMAALLGLYGEPLDRTMLEPMEIAAAARTLKRAGAFEEASTAADLAVSRAIALDTRRGCALGDLEEPLRARAEIAKARGDRVRALADYTHLAESVDDPRVRLELAKLYEHYVKDVPRAFELAMAGTGEGDEAHARRVSRLSRKLDCRGSSQKGVK